MKPVVVQNTEDEVPAEILARDIQNIADAMDRLFSTRLKPSTIYLLVSKASGVGMRDTECVLTHARALAQTYLKPKAQSAKK